MSVSDLCWPDGDHTPHEWSREMEDIITLIRPGKRGMEFVICVTTREGGTNSTVYELSDGKAMAMMINLQEYFNWRFYDAVTKKGGGGTGPF